MKVLSSIIFCALASLSSANWAWAEPVLTVTCESPKGRRVDYGREPLGSEKIKLEEGTDSFTGVTPIFIIDSNTPEKLTVIWGDTKMKGVPEAFLLPTKARQHPIVHLSDKQITAVDSYNNGVWVYSLFPKLEFGVFTRQTHSGIQEAAIGSLFYSKCQFAYSEKPKTR